jgi:hypothetical protein
MSTPEPPVPPSAAPQPPTPSDPQPAIPPTPAPPPSGQPQPVDQNPRWSIVPPAPPTYQPTAAAPPAPHAPQQPKPKPRGEGITFGLVLVLIGMALLASQFIPGLDLWRLWPLIIVAVGIRVMIRGDDE